MLRTDALTDGRTDGQTGPITRPAFAKATQVKTKYSPNIMHLVNCEPHDKKNLFLLHEKSKGVDQLARMCKLVYTFVIGLCYSLHPLPCGLERY